MRCAIPKDGERSFVPPGGRCRSAGPRRENCPALLPASRPQARNAGLQTGIAAAGRETPVATCAHSWNPTPGRRNAPWVPIRRPRCVLRHTEGWRTEFRPPPGDDAGLQGPTGRTAQRSYRHRGHRLGTPVFRPASRPQAAKLPSLPAPIAGTPHQDDETPLGFLSAVPVVRCAIPKDGERSFVPPGGRCRSAGPRRENCPALLPASRPQARNAGLQTGIAAAGRETPVATCAHSWNPTPGRRNVPWVPIRQTKRPGLCAAPYRRKANGVSSTSGGRCRSEGPPGRTAQRSYRHRGHRLGTPVFRPASRPQAAKLPSLPAPIAGTPHQDDETPPGFLSAVPVVRCAIPKDGERSFAPPGGRCRSEGPHRENCPALLPALLPARRCVRLRREESRDGEWRGLAPPGHERPPPGATGAETRVHCVRFRRYTTDRQRNDPLTCTPRHCPIRSAGCFA